MRSTRTASLLILSFIFAAPAALASGSGGGGGGGGGGYGSGIGTYPSTPRDPAAEAYSRGKSMVSRRIACKQCAYPDGVKDTPTAQKVAERVRAGEFDLKPGEREQVIHYLSRRFGS